MALILTTIFMRKNEEALPLVDVNNLLFLSEHPWCMPFLFQTSISACKFYREALLHLVFPALNRSFVRRHKHLLRYKYLDVVNSGGEPRRWNKKLNASTITITRFSSIEIICKSLGMNWLSHFSPMLHFYTPWKCQKTFEFLTFSGGIEMEHWAKMG